MANDYVNCSGCGILIDTCVSGVRQYKEHWFCGEKCYRAFLDKIKTIIQQVIK